MNSEYTIVLADGDLLSRVCGTNDSNLKLIEKHIGVPVFTRGNEISIDEEDPHIQQEFKFIIDRIVDEISDSGESSSDLVLSILNTGFLHGCADTEFNAGRYAISIPGSTRKIYPKTKNQADLVKAFRQSDLVFAEGPAGSGKTFLAVAEALRLVLTKKVNSILLTRPVVEAGESLGFLPGALEDKINPYLRPLYDSMNACLPREIVHKLTENGIIEIAPLAYMRGRTLNNCAVILDEAQNTTVEQMKMFLTRMGENSKVFVTGDTTQVDLPKRIPSGLIGAMRILGDIPEISMVRLSADDVVRSSLVRKIVQAFSQEVKDE
ncbi:PhoH family protein [uncultured Treponema sp.]|uniref:PhoH family protein n=1 Tax=uncultured Treponema sp. TaxID=162155 RepID=UPI0025CDD73C|nr:PhoH family protein [uncultured Treponema sp.]MBQ7539314.1 PhoH family protein [Treponema sp.]